MYKKIAFLSWLLSACLVGKVQAETIAADLLLYRVDNQHAAAPYLSRIMVSDDMLRMDEPGDDDSMQGYLLFDRKARLVLSVDPGTRTIMVIAPSPDAAAAKPADTLDIQSRPLDDAPLFAGKKPREHLISIQGKECTSLVAVEGEMPRAMKALREMSSVVADRHMRQLAIAGEMAEKDCKLWLDAYYPGVEYSKGLMLTLVSDSENRHLVDYKQSIEVDSELFEAPLEYNRFPMP